jgi:hypothetical protein
VIVIFTVFQFLCLALVRFVGSIWWCFNNKLHNTNSNNRWCCLANRKREFVCLLNEENEDGPYFNFCGTTQISLLVFSFFVD